MIKSTGRLYNNTLHEKHHILPKSFGGSDDENNIAILTFREHYIAHLLLTKFTTGKYKRKMLFALHCFFHFNVDKRNIRRGKTYETHKKYMAEAYQNRKAWVKSDTFIFKNISTGEIFTGTRKTFRMAYGLTNQEIYNLIHNGFKNSKNWTSKNWSIYNNVHKCYSNNIDKAPNKAYSKQCMYCKRTVDSRNYGRWHGEKCKLNTTF